MSQIAAQDETPTLTPFPTETIIPTLPPTETATELPSATLLPSETPTEIPSATPLPSETPTVFPSETPTLLPTPTASETAVEPPTLTVTVEGNESPALTLTLDASLSPSPTPTITLSPTVDITVNSTATLLATASSTLVPTLTPIPMQSSLRQNAVSAQSLSGNVIEIRNIDDVSDFSMAIDTANANCNNTYVLYLTPDLYPVTPEPGENRGLTITGQVIIVGNAFSSPATSSTVPDTEKVIFEPDGNTGIFYVTSNSCGTEGSLSLYNVVLRGGRNTVNGGGGAITNESVLNIYNSYLVDNQASYWGGAILSTGTTTIINSVFENNRSTSISPNTGGGAIFEIYAGPLLLECTTFIDNHSFNVGGALHIDQTVTGSITLMHNADVQRSNNFINNTALIGYGNIYNESPTLDASYQHWNPTPSSGSIFGADYSAPLTSPVEQNCAIPPVPALPTPTPTPIVWSANGTVSIIPDQPIPPLQKVYKSCDDAFRQTDEAKFRRTRAFCAEDTYQRYVNKYGGKLTWEQIVALLLYEEGNSILLGTLQGNEYVLGIPQDPDKGNYCFNNPNAPNTNGYPQISTVSQCTSLQNNFTYAAVELLYNKCAFGNYSNYQGTCKEESLFEYTGDPNNPGYLASSQSFFNDPKDDENQDGDVLDANPFTYAEIARTRLNQFAYDPNLPGNPHWGICPCSWENVELTVDPKPYGTKWTYSYFQTTLNYFRIYGPS